MLSTTTFTLPLGIRDEIELSSVRENQRGWLRSGGGNVVMWERNGERTVEKGGLCPYNGVVSVGTNWLELAVAGQCRVVECVAHPFWRLPGG
jgi:hypothetical protein